MSHRKTLQLICGLAGGSAVLLLAAADSRGCFGGEGGRWSGFTVLQAAQPAWTPARHTPAATGLSWDFNWDKRDPSALTNGKKKEVAAEELSSEPDNGKVKATRNILLIRHSQYNLSGSSDRERILTPLGVELVSCDLLREGGAHRARPARHALEAGRCDLPPVTAPFNLSTVLQQYHEDGARIEAAFRRYIHRADPKQKEDSYEIIVCHANVIRYFVCRFVSLAHS
ncbi:unnamed protein product [Lampetra planeri]